MPLGEKTLWSQEGGGEGWGAQPAAPTCVQPSDARGGGGLAGLPERTGAATAGHVHGAHGEGRATVHCA